MFKQSKHEWNLIHMMVNMKYAQLHMDAVGAMLTAIQTAENNLCSLQEVG